ncbi:hypothetical protein [Duganella sp.]|uniref:hypothetical protein n=1 Tax=Duganella sp. TaxID=1904440 RepID=UPI0031CF3B8A
MFPALTNEILADLDRFQALVEAQPDDPRGLAVVQALQQSAAAFEGWAGIADPALRKESQTLHAGLQAAVQICQSLQQAPI